jgi:hypothetical protein
MSSDEQITFLLQEHARLLAEVRVMREWVLRLAAVRVASSKEDVDVQAERLEAQMEEQIATQLDITLQNLETKVSSGLAAMLDNRSLEEVALATKSSNYTH